MGFIKWLINTVLKWVCIFAAIIFIVFAAAEYFLGIEGVPSWAAFWRKTPVVIAETAEVECLTAHIARDSRDLSKLLEPPAAREQIGEANIRNAANYNHGKICGIDPLNPPGRSRKVPLVTLAWEMRKQVGEGAWAEDTLLAQKLYKDRKRIAATKGATHYIRAEKPGWGILNKLGIPSAVDIYAQSPFMKSDMRTMMEALGRARDQGGKEVGTAEFFRAK